MSDAQPSDSTNPPSPRRPHLPVMLAEVMQTLAPAEGETYIDGTVGPGGYTTAILNAANTRPACPALSSRR